MGHTIRRHAGKEGRDHPATRRHGKPEKEQEYEGMDQAKPETQREICAMGGKYHEFASRIFRLDPK
jgi:hypothetical protein